MFMFHAAAERQGDEIPVSEEDALRTCIDICFFNKSSWKAHEEIIFRLYPHWSFSVWKSQWSYNKPSRIVTKRSTSSGLEKGTYSKKCSILPCNMSNSLHRKGEDSEGYHENLKYRDQEFEKIASAAAGARKSCYSAEATLRLRQILLDVFQLNFWALVPSSKRSRPKRNRPTRARYDERESSRGSTRSK